ncbi:MAG TPA: FtsX-like permease family protein [Tepidisphaeraceae bacterium]|nr:FtsX-like permease family protein [Tepidisphaeraceae bacterium]
MYKLTLILKYLRKRRIAWVSLLAVILCTAMVLVVISVMGGWLRMFKEGFHGATGDIVIARPGSLSGFPYYQEMIERIEQLPEVNGAAPMLRSGGLMKIGGYRDVVQVVGLVPEKMGRVNGFTQSLFRQTQNADTATNQPSFKLPLPADEYRAYADRAVTDPADWPGAIVGTYVIARKNEKGELERPAAAYRLPMTITVLGIDEESSSVDINNKVQRPYWVVDDSRTKIWQIDDKTIYVPFELLQKDLRMEAFGDAPARTNEVAIGLKPGTNLEAARAKIRDIVIDIAKARNLPMEEIDGVVALGAPVKVMLWQEVNAKFIGAVEREKVLVTMLFGIISIVAVFLIFCIFFMIVVEKTRDIGIIKSVGATSAGVAQVFLGYGLAIGLTGAVLGTLAGYLIVKNINWLHEMMGTLMGVKIWDAEAYAFDTIPNTLNPNEMIVIFCVAVIASVIGALVPAIRAARLNPVEALRWE